MVSPFSSPSIHPPFPKRQQSKVTTRNNPPEKDENEAPKETNQRDKKMQINPSIFLPNHHVSVD
jgi:hypothetical protein